MNPRRDMIIGAIACIVIFFFFVSIDLYETVSDFTRDQEGWLLVELLAAVPTLALVTSWFAVRRWLEVAHLNDRLAHTVGQLKEAIQERQAMEEQIGEAYKMAAMGQLAGGLTRELNNVMQPIVTLAQLGVDQTDSEPQKENMGRILLAAERGCKILESSLADPAGGFGEAEEIVPSRGLSGVIAEVAKSVGNDVTIVPRFNDASGVISVNREEFDSVFTSLLTNAAQAMKRGGEITVGLSAQTLDEAQARVQGVSAGSYFSVTVADQGIGMTDDVLAQVFDPFFTTKSADGCAGLGLTIAYDQVHGWSGRITAESSYGEGSTFQVLIPRHQADEALGG
ncbi:MAG: ATP-binding protein [Acidimicrobiaceae bacterium]|nr:ATP-binding protein [Acidimicrobiaceae bacterium]